MIRGCGSSFKAEFVPLVCEYPALVLFEILNTLQSIAVPEVCDVLLSAPLHTAGADEDSACSQQWYLIIGAGLSCGEPNLICKSGHVVGVHGRLAL